MKTRYFLITALLLLSLVANTAQAQAVGLKAYGTATLSAKGKTFLFDLAIKIDAEELYVQWLADNGQTLGEFYFDRAKDRRKVKIMGQKLRISEWSQIFLATAAATKKYEVLYTWQQDKLENMTLLLKKGKIKLNVKYLDQTWQHESTK